MVKLLPALAVLAALPAVAGDAPNLDPTAPAMPGAVALLLSAETLYAMGQTAQDPLMVLTAARMMGGLAVITTPRIADGKTNASTTALPGFDAKAMIAVAKSIDAGQTYSDLIESEATLTPPAPKSLRATASALAPGSAESWTLPFYGGTYAEVAVLGGAAGNLDVVVADDKGHSICADYGNSDSVLCGFTPLDNGEFTVTVTNSGLTGDSYTLFVN